MSHFCNMSDFLRTIARCLKVSERTVRRWCEDGNVPGAYRTKGGHWRLRKGKIDFGNPRLGTFESRLAQAVILSRQPPTEIKRQLQRAAEWRTAMGGEPNKRFDPGFKFALDFSFTFRIVELNPSARLTRDEMDRFNIAVEQRRDAFHPQTAQEVDCEIGRAQYPALDAILRELDSLLWDQPLSRFMVPAVREAAGLSAEQRLCIAVMSVANRCGRATASEIAKEMRITRATLYRRYSPDEIKKVVTKAPGGEIGNETAKMNGRALPRQF